MNQELVSQIAQNGPTFAMLVVAVVYFYRRDVRNDTRNESRTSEIQKRCDDERESLVGRIQELEDRMHQASEQTLAKVSDSLALNTRALSRFCDDHGSGYHPSVEKS